MFDRREARAFPGSRREDLFRAAGEWWSRQGFYVYQRAPFHATGESYNSKVGLRREFDLRMGEVNGIPQVDLTLRARISDEGLIGGALVTVLFWPAAVVGGAISYDRYENDARNLMGAFWTSLGLTTPPTAPRATPPPGLYCAKCGAGLQTEWKVCPYCGSPKPGT